MSRAKSARSDKSSKPASEPPLSRKAKGERTRARMVETCGELLREVGYRGTKLSEVIDRSGAPRGSIYFHFPGGKDELVCLAIVTAGRQWREQVQDSILGAADLGEAVQAACETIARRLEETEFRQGCPVATVTLEAASEHPAIRQAAADHFRENEEIVERYLVAAGLPPDRARPLGTLFLSSVEGALLLSRAYADATPLRTVGSTLAALFTASQQPLA